MKFQLDHVAIRCEDYEKSKKYYQDLLGAKIIFESKSILDGCPYSLLYIGGEELKGDLLNDHYAFSTLETIELLGQPADGTKKANGLSHVCYRVENVKDAYELAKAKGVKFVDQYQNGMPKAEYGEGIKIAFFNGPDGERTEFFHIHKAAKK